MTIAQELARGRKLRISVDKTKEIDPSLVVAKFDALDDFDFEEFQRECAPKDGEEYVYIIWGEHMLRPHWDGSKPHEGNYQTLPDDAHEWGWKVDLALTKWREWKIQLQKRKARQEMNLESVIAEAHKLADEIGLTLNLNASDIEISIEDGHVEGEEGAAYNSEKDKIYLGLKAPPAVALMHEGIHQKVTREISPSCPGGKYSDYKLMYAEKLFGEALAYGAELFLNRTDSENIEQRVEYLCSDLECSDRYWYCPSPELAKAIAKACKNGVKMDEIFEKVKGFIPKLPPFDVPLKFYFTYAAAQFITKVLKQPITDFYSNKDMTAFAEELEARLPKEGN
jgi:hypothetical protein